MFDESSVLQTASKLFRAWCAWPWARAAAYGAIVAGLAFGVVGVWMGVHATETVAVATNVQQPTCPELPASTFITVDVSGAAVRPGVYQIPSNSRGSDALAAAGGFSPEADLVVVAEQLNLAQQLSDGDKVFIPFIDLIDSAPAQEPSEQLVFVNSASLKELESLAGIGDKRAADIVSQRPYASLQELVNKGVLTQKLFDANKHLLRL